MTLTPAAAKVLHDILSVGADRALALGRRIRVPTPTAEQLYEFCELLATTPGEEPLQKFLEERPGFLTGLLGGPDNADLAVLFKPAVGTQYNADFCVLQAHQGGAFAHLVEIESSHEPLFTQQGNTAKRLAGAQTQIEDWKIWIQVAREHYARELVRAAKALPPLANYQPGDRGFRLVEPDDLQRIWRGFGGESDPHFTFTIVIGRWSQLNAEEKARILNRNKQPQLLRIHTYEQVARSANYRLERDDWYNAHDDWQVLAAPTNPLT